MPFKFTITKTDGTFKTWHNMKGTEVILALKTAMHQNEFTSLEVAKEK